MTAASAYPPGSDQGPSDGRASEPSMEDILASIRRIIADDQQANGSRLGARRSQPANAAVAPAAPPVVAASASNASHREEILDLASYLPAAQGAEAEHQTPFHAEDHQEMPAGIERQPAEAAFDPASVVGADEADPSAQAPAADTYGASDAYDSEVESRDLSLLASPMSESVMSAFEALAATVVLENKPMLEGILRDLLRPMLKSWLDDNLPGLVERLVRIEIERVARGGRG